MQLSSVWRLRSCGLSGSAVLSNCNRGASSRHVCGLSPRGACGVGSRWGVVTSCRARAAAFCHMRFDFVLSTSSINTAKHIARDHRGFADRASRAVMYSTEYGTRGARSVSRPPTVSLSARSSDLFLVRTYALTFFRFRRGVAVVWSWVSWDRHSDRRRPAQRYPTHSDCHRTSSDRTRT